MLYVIIDREDEGKEIHRFDSMKITYNSDQSDNDDEVYTLKINDIDIMCDMSKNEINMVTDLIAKLISLGRDICIHESEIYSTISYDDIDKGLKILAEALSE